MRASEFLFFAVPSSVNIFNSGTVQVNVSVRTWEIYYQAEHALSVFRATKKKELTCDLPQPVSASENAHLQLKLELINGDKTVLSFTSNEKQALVQEFNNDTNSHTNIIYSFTYGDNNFMLYFYIALCVILLLFIIMTFYLIIIRQMTVQKFYVPVALFLGLIFQCLVHPELREQ